MATRRIIIVNEYLRLSQKVTKSLNKQVMSSLNEYDLSA